MGFTFYNCCSCGVTDSASVVHCGSYIKFQYTSRLPIVVSLYSYLKDTLWFDLECALWQGITLRPVLYTHIFETSNFPVSAYKLL